MNKLFSIVVLAAIVLSVTTCNYSNKKKNNQANNKQTIQINNHEKPINYLTVNDVFTKGDSLSGTNLNVEGIIDHVCNHTWKRFKIIGENENQFIKIQLGNKFSSVDASIIGKKVKVTGKLIPIKMDKKMVKEWEDKVKVEHKGEEDTEHFKEEIAFIQGIYQKISSGEISYYTSYIIEAENYELE